MSTQPLRSFIMWKGTARVLVPYIERLRDEIELTIKY